MLYGLWGRHSDHRNVFLFGSACFFYIRESVELLFPGSTSTIDRQTDRQMNTVHLLVVPGNTIIIIIIIIIMQNNMCGCIILSVWGGLWAISHY